MPKMRVPNPSFAVVRFSYDRRYSRRGYLIDTPWFAIRFYPIIWSSFTFWRKGGR